MSTSNTHKHRAVAVESDDGARAELLITAAPAPTIGLLWVPAMGVPARHYEGFADALSARGIVVARHEWRGVGSSSLRAGRDHDWGYRALLDDIAVSLAAARTSSPDVRWLVAGHSLGAQLAAILFASQPSDVEGLVVVAGGMPYWKNFPGLRGIGIRSIFELAPAIARWRGHFPGRRFGFAGNEARGVIADWSESGRSGRYVATDVIDETESAFVKREGPVLGVWLDEDGFTPRRSFDHLLDKLALAGTERRTLSRGDFNGRKADHFGWIKHSDPVVDAIVQWIAANPHLTKEFE